MTDQTRADFEAHFGLTTRQKWQHKDGSYKFPEIQSKWEGYLAGVAKATPTEQEPVAWAWWSPPRDKNGLESRSGLSFKKPEVVQGVGVSVVPLYAAPVAAAASVSTLTDCDIIAIANRHIEGWIANDKSVILECVTAAIREALRSAAAAPGAEK